VKIPFGKREFTILGALLFLAFLVRFLFFSNQGYQQVDTQDFMIWFQRAANIGPRVFYNDNYWCDYPPFNIYFFWVFGLIAKNLSLFGSTFFTYVMKLPPNLFDMGTAFLIFAFVRKRAAFKIAVLATALYAFNPAVIFNAAVWGQFDAIYTFFLVLSLYLVFCSKPKFAVVAFMLGVLTKPQSIALAPLFIFLLYKKYDWKGLFISVLVAVVTIFVVILPFEWSNPVSFLAKIYFGAYQGYGYTTVNAFNVWAFGGMWQVDTQISFIVGWAMFLALAGFTLYFVNKRFKASNELTVIFAAFVLFFGFFMLPTRIHERYLFPAIAVLALMIPFLKKIRPLYVVLTLTCLANQAYVLSFLTAGQFIQAGDLVMLVVSLINLIAFIYVLMLMVLELRGKRWLSPNNIQAQMKTPASSEGEG
jgi:Gpi18-like mannosyltransferase